MDSAGSLKQPRQERVGRYKVWLLQKRLAELSTQVEASVIEARQLILWKQSQQPLTVADLTDEDRRILEHHHRVRLTEVVQKHCFGALKSITQHKWAFPFNNPVDTMRFPDYPKVITHPMDFSTIKARQDSGYYRDPKDWWHDIMLVFSNAKRYNAPGSDCYLMAQTLQEVSEEKYDKVIAPRLAEEAAAMLRDEMYLKKRRAELVNQQISEAMDAQCAVLFSLMAELHAAIREAKMLAASLCEPLTLEEKQALAATIQGLPTAQLESIVAFVASRHPPSVSHSEVPAGTGGVPSRKVQLNLGRYDPLLLRQLQHLVTTCTASRQQQQQQQQQVGAGAYARAAAAAQGQAGTASEADRSVSPSPAPSPGLPTAAAAAQPPPTANGPAGGAPGDPPASAPAGAGVSAERDPAPGERPMEQAPAAGGPSGTLGPAAAVPAPPPAPVPVPPPPPPTSTQRNIADVVTNATASGISLRAGIRWPGLAVGAGVRPRARALLSLSFEGPGAASEVLAGCPMPQPSAERTPGGLSGRKRRAQGQLDAEARAHGLAAGGDGVAATASGQPASAAEAPANGPLPEVRAIGA